MTMGHNAPCYTCTRHSEICHAQCQEYHEWAQALRQGKAAQRVGDGADEVLITNLQRRKKAWNDSRRGQR